MAILMVQSLMLNLLSGFNICTTLSVRTAEKQRVSRCFMAASLVLHVWYFSLQILLTVLYSVEPPYAHLCINMSIYPSSPPTGF